MFDTAPTCRQCKRGLERGPWLAAGGARCPRCQAALEFVAFPALTATRAQARAQAAVPADDAACFFHADNRAETVCEGCGRYLCTVCGIDFGGKRLCPQCVSGRRTTDQKQPGRDIVLHDTVAFALALGPLLIFWLTLVTAPLALGYVIYAWRKPLSVLRRSRWRLVVAGVFALLEIAGWVVFFGMLALNG